MRMTAIAATGITINVNNPFIFTGRFVSSFVEITTPTAGGRVHGTAIDNVDDTTSGDVESVGNFAIDTVIEAVSIGDELEWATTGYQKRRTGNKLAAVALKNSAANTSCFLLVVFDVRAMSGPAYYKGSVSTTTTTPADITPVDTLGASYALPAGKGATLEATVLTQDQSSGVVYSWTLRQGYHNTAGTVTADGDTTFSEYPASWAGSAPAFTWSGAVPLVRVTNPSGSFLSFARLRVDDNQ